MAIYVGTQKVKPSGIAKVYVGDTVVYQASSPYRKLEYIKTSGAEYVDLQQSCIINTNQPLRIKYEVSFISNPGGTTAIGAMKQVSGSWYRHHWFSNGGTGFEYWVGTGGFGTYYQVDYSNTHHVFDLAYTEPWKFYYDTSLMGTADTLANCNLNYYLGARNRGNSIDGYCRIQIYACAFINESGDNVLVPVQRKSDSVCGLYNLLTNTFLPMTGTNITSAAAGPTVEED